MFSHSSNIQNSFMDFFNASWTWAWLMRRYVLFWTSHDCLHGRIRNGMVGYTRKRKETLIIMLQAKFYIYIHVINTCIAKFFYILFIVYVSVNLYFFYCSWFLIVFNCFLLWVCLLMNLKWYHLYSVTNWSNSSLCKKIESNFRSFIGKWTM